jgi:AcrR family transcriptional regulator
MRSKEEVVQEFRVQSLRDAAMRVIARRGMAAATMQEIADEAGVAKGTIYLYFKDRDELVDSTFESALRQLHERIDAAVEAEGTIEGKLRAGIRTILSFFKGNREFFRLYAEHRFPEGSSRRHQRHCDQYRERTQRLAAMLEKAMEQGEIRRLDARRLALFVTEGINAIVVERVMEEDPPPEEQDVELIVDVILGGVRAERSAE